MTRNGEDFATALAKLLDARAASEEHPAPELLVAYHHDQLPAAQADAVQEHVAACRECGDLLLELMRFPASGSKDKAEDKAEDKPEDKAGSGRRIYALAASLLLVSLGLGAWVAVLSGELRAARQPQVNLPILNLEPAGYSRSEGEPETLRSTGERFVVILNPPAEPPSVEHGVEVRHADGRPVWSGTGLQPTGVGNFHLELPHRLLPPGAYRIRLHRGGETVAEFDLEVTP